MLPDLARAQLTRQPFSQWARRQLMQRRVGVNETFFPQQGAHLPTYHQLLCFGTVPGLGVTA